MRNTYRSRAHPICPINCLEINIWSVHPEALSHNETTRAQHLINPVRLSLHEYLNITNHPRHPPSWFVSQTLHILSLDWSQFHVRDNLLKVPWFGGVAIKHWGCFHTTATGPPQQVVIVVQKTSLLPYHTNLIYTGSRLSNELTSWYYCFLIVAQTNGFAITLTLTLTLI